MNFNLSCELLLTCILLYLIRLKGAICLEVSSLNIPSQVTLGRSVLLTCKYSLQGDKLYSITWLKDGQEFLNIRPKYPTHVYSTRGIYLKVEDPSGSRILLWKTDINSQGEYACEVTGEAPKFVTSIKKAQLSLIALPNNGPRLKGGKKQYNVGDKLNLTCTSGPSYPAANLSWYINGHRINGIKIKQDIINLNDGLKITKSKLHFIIEPDHLVNGEIKLRCLATILDLYWSSAEEPPKESRIPPEIQVIPSFLSHSHQSISKTISFEPDILIIITAIILDLILTRSYQT